MQRWSRCARYCAAVGLRPLPVHYVIVAGYVGVPHLRGTIAAGRLSNYLAPVTTVHELARYPAPTAHPMFTRLRKGYMRLTALSAGQLPAYVGPLPADLVRDALLFGMKHKGALQRRACAGLTLAFLLFNRPGAAAALRAVDLAFSDQALLLDSLYTSWRPAPARNWHNSSRGTREATPRTSRCTSSAPTSRIFWPAVIPPRCPYSNLLPPPSVRAL